MFVVFSLMGVKALLNPIIEKSYLLTISALRLMVNSTCMIFKFDEKPLLNLKTI